jgi:hypothetical protein
MAYHIDITSIWWMLFTVVLIIGTFLYLRMVISCDEANIPFFSPELKYRFRRKATVLFLLLLLFDFFVTLVSVVFTGENVTLWMILPVVLYMALVVDYFLAVGNIVCFFNGLVVAERQEV